MRAVRTVHTLFYRAASPYPGRAMPTSPPPRCAVAAAFLLFPAIVLAQSPMVTSVVNSLSGEPKLAPGLTITVSYTPLAFADLQSSSPAYGSPFPAVSVSIGPYGGVVMGVQTDSSGGGIVTLMIPREVPVGPATLVLRNSRGVSAPFYVQIDAYSPALRPVWSSCDGSTQVVAFNAEGLGATNPPSPSIGYPPLGQAFPTAVKPTVTVAGLAAVVRDSAGNPPYAGYSGSFEVPADAPEGIQPVVLTIGGVSAKPVDLLVGTQNNLPGHAGGSLPDLIQAAPQAIVQATNCRVVFGRDTLKADPRNPPLALGATEVRIQDSAGVERLAGILSAAPGQVEYVVPEGTANGRAMASISVDGQVVSASPLDIDTVQPSVFYTAYLIRVRDGAASMEPLPTDWFGPGTIDLGPAMDQVYLIIPATGIRNRSSLEHVSLHFAAYSSFGDWPVAYAGAQGEYAGLDQVNVPLRRFPPGTAPEDGVSVQVMVDSILSNELYLHFTQID